MEIKLILTSNDYVYEVGDNWVGTPAGGIELSFEIGEIVSTFFMTAREDWFAIIDTEGNLRKMINPRNVVEVDVG